MAFLAALAMIVVKGFVSTERMANFIAAPAGASAARPVNHLDPDPPSPSPLPSF